MENRRSYQQERVGSSGRGSMGRDGSRLGSSTGRPGDDWNKNNILPNSRLGGSPFPNNSQMNNPTVAKTGDMTKFGKLNIDMNKRTTLGPQRKIGKSDSSSSISSLQSNAGNNKSAESSRLSASNLYA